MSNIYLHLIGQDPVTKLIFQPAFPTNDSFWNHAGDKTYGECASPRCIASCPKKDVERLPEETRERSLEALEFILEKSDYLGEWENPDNPKINEQGISYSVAIRILANLATHKIWFGALPETRETETWKRYKSLPEEETKQVLPEYLQLKVAAPQNITAILGGRTHQFTPIPEWQGELEIYENIGLKVLEKEYLIPTGIPFVCVHLDADARYGNSHEYPTAIGNTAFLALMRSDPKAADKMFETAVMDQFHFQEQNYDQCYYDEDQFLEETDTGIHLLLEEGLAHKKTLTSAEKAIRKTAEQICASYLPHLMHPLRYGRCELHLKTFSLTKAGITLQATLQTKDETHKVQIFQDGTAKIDSTKRNRSSK